MTTNTDERSFWRRLLQEPRYGFERDGLLYRPRAGEVLAEVLWNCNIFRSRKNWIGFVSFCGHSLLLLNAVFYFARLASGQYSLWTLCALPFVTFVLGPIFDGVLHRGLNHKAYKFRTPAVSYLLQNLCLPDIPKEIHHLPHFVHHQLSDKVGDPYNASQGWFPLWWSDFNHHKINPQLSREDYQRARALCSNVLVYQNSYEQYQFWGSVCHPAVYVLETAINAMAWYFLFSGVNGGGLLSALYVGHLFNICFIVRFLNYWFHGAGKRKPESREEQFNPKDLSYNHPICILTTGQHHVVHHLFARSADTAYLKGQFDLAFMYLRLFRSLGLIHSFKDYRDEYFAHYYPATQEQLQTRLSLQPDFR